MTTTLEKAYDGASVLVTGHTGFKGGWLAFWLKQLGARVTGLSLAPEDGAKGFFHAASVARGARSLLGDVRDPRDVRAAFRAARPDYVFHLAAQPLVLRSYRQPRETFETNVLGTVNVLDAALEAKATVVAITSDKCYHNPEDGKPRREDDRMGGKDPYSASKGAAELVIDSYLKSFFAPAGLGLAAARAGNVIGGGDWSENRLIPDCVRALGADRPILVRNPASVRPWQHVLEPVSGYLWLGARLAADPKRFSGGWNFGPAQKDALTVREVVRLALAAWGGGAMKVGKATGPHEAALLVLDGGKARRALGWKPAYSAREAIERTMAWYKLQGSLGRRFAGEEISAAQIEHYTHKAAGAGAAWARGNGK